MRNVERALPYTVETTLTMPDSEHPGTTSSDNKPRPKATRIDDGSTFYTRVVPALLITLGVITLVMIVVSVGVLLGIF